jgi:hypothetical protein
VTLRSRSLTLRVRLARYSRPYWSSVGPLRRLQELEIARMPDKAGSNLALRGIRLDLNVVTVRYVFIGPVALTEPSLIPIVANKNERPGPTGASRMIRGCQ